MDEVNKLKIALYHAKNPHPFLGSQPTWNAPNLVFSMKSSYTPPADDTAFPQMAFSIEKIKVVEEDRVERLFDDTVSPELSLIAAEELALKDLNRVKYKSGTGFMSHLRVECSNIAKKSRRGMGNIIIANSGTLNELFGSVSYHEMKRFTVVERSFVQDNTVHLVYGGSAVFDRFAFVQQTLIDVGDTPIVAGTFLVRRTDVRDWGVTIKVT